MELEEEHNEKAAKDLETIFLFFLNRNLPMNFNPYDETSVLINGEKEFEDICNSMEEAGARDIKDSTVFEFYSKVQYLEKKVQKHKSYEPR